MMQGEISPTPNAEEAKMTASLANLDGVIQLKVHAFLKWCEVQGKHPFDEIADFRCTGFTGSKALRSLSRDFDDIYSLQTILEVTA